MEEPDLRFLPLEDRALSEPASKRRRAVTFGLAAFVTMGGLVVALILGTIGYDIRRSNMHEARLHGILVQTPTVYQVTEGLKEKAPLVTIVESEAALKEAARRWGADKTSEILEKARLWPQLRIYAAGDMMYFIFFDASGVMRDYVYVSS
jgi:hypothetical protein